MVNTITLSTDLNTLYLIDGERVIPYALTERRGVLIGLVGGQVSVVSGKVPLPEPEVLEDQPRFDESGPGPEALPRSAERVEVSPRRGRSTKFQVKPRNQFTTIFNDDSGVLAIVGATDIVSTIDDPGNDGPGSGECQIFLIDLKENIGRLRRVGDALIVEEVKKR